MSETEKNGTNFYILGAAILVVTGLFDQVFKKLVMDHRLAVDNDWLLITSFHNFGVLGGLFGDLHPMIIRVLFSALFGFILIFATLILYLLEYKNVPTLKYGIVLYISGILGNVWDRMYLGSVVDFINLKIVGLEDFAFNIADIVLVVGFSLITLSLFRDYREIWFIKNQRRQMIVDARFQFSYSAILVIVGFMNFVIAGIYSYTFLKVYVEGGQEIQIDPKVIIRDYLLGLILLQGIFFLISFIVGLLFSHRMAGPIYSFQRYMAQLLANPTQVKKFRLRKSDHFKSLEHVADSFRERF